MAEIAAGALVAEQVVSTSVEVGVAATLAKPTQPLHATLTQIATTPTHDQALSLARSHHTVTVINNKAYIFGGQLANSKLCNTDVHSIAIPSSSTTAPGTGSTGASEYACYPAFPLQDSSTGEVLVPSPRTDHAAAARGQYLLIHGGCGADGEVIQEDNCLWLFDTETLRWSKIKAVTQIGKTMASRWGHGMFVDEKQDLLVLHGGEGRQDTWMYDFNAVAWTEMPSCPSLSVAAAFVDGVLYSIDAPESDGVMGGSLHILRLGNSAIERQKPDALTWEKVEFPANGLIPGPRARVGAALVPITSGVGRQYLAYMFGARPANTGEQAEEEEPHYSDIWTLQLPSTGFTAAAIKDVIRDKIPGSVTSGALSWSELDILPTEQTEHQGKVHPGPRGFFGASTCSNGKGIVTWGGVNALGASEADGWLLTI